MLPLSASERGSNGAKRNMHYEMEVEEKDVTPDDDIVLNKAAVEIGVKDFILEQSNLLYSNEHQHKIGID